MFAKIITIVALALAVDLYMAVPAAQARTKTFKGTFKSSGETIDVISDFSFDGSTTNSAGLNTFWSTDSLGDVGPGQSVSEYSFDSSAACSFKGLSGTTESGGTLTLVGAAGAGHAFGCPLFGDTFLAGSTGTGCFNSTTGDFAGTETDLFVGGTGANKNATGSATYKFVGVTLGPSASPPGYGFFRWFESKGTFVEKVP